MHWTKGVALLPVLGVLIGTPLFNQTQPLILGLPLLLAWLVFCVVLTAAAMGVVYLCDPARRAGGGR